MNMANAAAHERVRAAADGIDQDLPELARAVIRQYLDAQSEDTQSFLARPDARNQHQTRWHQWGIITHTRVFLRHLDEDIPRFLTRWGLWEIADTFLSRPIDGAARWDLLRIGVLLHDIGKFAARTRGRERYHFTGHERLSGQIIRENLDLSRYGLTPDQMEYVARTAEDHFVLGLIRKRARDQGTYDLNFVSGPRFPAVALDIKRTHPEDFVEIGILFLGDSLAKAQPDSGPPDALTQYDLNIHVAHRYLAAVLDRPV
ncbi:MAG TPA: HD domain-containing protein [Chloroflexota bacterium]|nr:HD domain-containing protein [Chloroflexota bacterium]